MHSNERPDPVPGGPPDPKPGAPPDPVPEPAPLPGDRPPAGGRIRRNWKRVGLALVVAFVVASVGRSVLPALGVHVPTGTSGGKPTTEAKSEAPPTVDLNGVLVPGGGQPIITVNPGLVRPGATVAVNGSGFDAGARVDILLGSAKSQKAQQVATVTVGKDGTINSSIAFPSEATGENTKVVTAQQRGSTKVAKAEAMLGQGVASATLSAAAGKPGDTVGLSAKGFASGEDLGVYWGRVNGEPTQILHADEHGSVSKVGVKVGVAPVGPSSLFIVGRKSGSAAGAPFQVLGLYPNVTVKPWAVKAMQRIGFTGKGFVPGERVLIHVNTAGGPPVAALATDGGGGFTNAGFMVPYELKGPQALVFIGEQSRAMANVKFSVLPFQPLVRASTYGGSPGTSISFYADGFGPGEAVHVFTGRGAGGGGELVSAFRVDGSGKARAAGSYLIPGNAGNGVTFSLVGARSGATATVTVKVDNSGGPVDIPPQPKYNLPKDLEK
jgi:hypothetical protein